MYSPILLSFLSVLLVSSASLVGIVFLSLSSRLLQKLIFWLVSFATGAILGNVFFHLLPESIENATHPETPFLLVFAGIIVSFLLEKIIHWHHCHHLGCAEHTHPVGTLVLIGDGCHNIIDGVLIASSYLVSVELGIATTIAVLLHEIPQEIGDFALLIHSGFSRLRALLWNFFSALSALVGVAFVLIAQQSLDGIETVLLPLTAGNFLYIALADLVPALHKESRPTRALLQLVCIGLGAALLFGLSAHEEHPEDAPTTELHAE